MGVKGLMRNIKGEVVPNVAISRFLCDLKDIRAL